MDVLTEGPSAYTPFFPAAPASVAALGAKTPHYAGDTQVPYRTRIVLGTLLKLLYTWRESLQLDATLYLYRASGQTLHRT